jgi:hypothetical protein
MMMNQKKKPMLFWMVFAPTAEHSGWFSGSDLALVEGEFLVINIGVLFSSKLTPKIEH